MKKCRITIIKKVNHKDLSDEFELSLNNPCPYQVGQTYISTDAKKPEELCDSAWISLYPYVFALANEATNLHGCWMKNKNQAIVSCNDGVRPVSFLIETICE